MTIKIITMMIIIKMMIMIIIMANRETDFLNKQTKMESYSKPP